MSGSGREVLKNIREWSKDHPGCPGVSGWPFRIIGSGREAHPNIREWSRNPPGCPGGPLGCPVVFGRPSLFPVFVGTSRMSGSF